MTGNITFNNNTGLFWKDTSGNARQVLVYSGDDNLYLNFPRGGFFRWNNAAGTSTLLTMDNSGNLTTAGFVSTPQVIAGNGSAANPGLRFAVDNDTGLFGSSDGVMGLTCNAIQTWSFSPNGTTTNYAVNIDTSARGTNVTSLYLQNSNGLAIVLQGSGPNGLKTLRLLGGTLDLVNSAYTNSIWGIDDAGNMRCAGNLNIGGTAYAQNFSASSDATLKHNWRKVDNFIEHLAAMPTYGLFDWKSGSGVGAGAVAQDYNKFIPELVSKNPVTGKLSVNYVGINAYAVIELSKKCVAQEARIIELENIINQIKEKLCL